MKRWAKFKPGDKVVVLEAHPGLGLKRKGRRGTVADVDPGLCGCVGVVFNTPLMKGRNLGFMPYELKRAK